MVFLHNWKSSSNNIVNKIMNGIVNPDLDKLLTANTHAGTTLKQVAFDKRDTKHVKVEKR